MLEESTNVEQYLTQAVAVAIELDPDAIEPPLPPPAPPEPEVPAPAPVPPAPEVPVSKQKEEERKEEEKQRRERRKEEEREKEKGKGGGKSLGEGSGKTATAATSVVVEGPPDLVRPTAVVPLRTTVEASGRAPLEDLSVCNRLPDGLTRLRAPGATVDGAVACWKVPKLAAGTKRTFLTTIRVDAAGAGRLTSTTVVRARNARTRRRRTTIRVAPLPPSACGSSLRPAGTRLARRC